MPILIINKWEPREVPEITIFETLFLKIKFRTPKEILVSLKRRKIIQNDMMQNEIIFLHTPNSNMAVKFLNNCFFLTWKTSIQLLVDRLQLLNFLYQKYD